MRESISRVFVSDGCAFAVDERDHILAWSDGAAKILGWLASEVVGEEACRFIEAKDLFGNRWCPGTAAFMRWLTVESRSRPFGSP